MLDTQPLDYLPIWGVYLLTVVLLYLSIEAGYRFSIFGQKRWPDHAESGVGVMVGASMASLGFMLAIIVGCAGQRTAVVSQASPTPSLTPSLSLAGTQPPLVVGTPGSAAVSGLATLVQVAPQHTPEPTASPDAIAGAAEEIAQNIGLAGSSFLGLNIEDWLNLLGSLLIVLAAYLLGTWVIGLGLGLLAIGYGFTNPPRVDALMTTASDDIAGSASSANSMGTESGSAAGMALSTTFAMLFAGRAFFNLGAKAELAPDQIRKAVEVLRAAMNDSLNTYPGISKSVLDQLFEGARTAHSMGIAQTMPVLAAVVPVSGAIIWFGMRKSTGEISS